ncbi:hypothetical protein SAMN05216379_11059 [Nitrosomonas eutropha]|nr:hypothetical protein SAMN05216379_11059 [Nitrosomonas eutropha]
MLLQGRSATANEAKSGNGTGRVSIGALGLVKNAIQEIVNRFLNKFSQVERCNLDM